MAESIRVDGIIQNRETVNEDYNDRDFLEYF